MSCCAVLAHVSASDDQTVNIFAGPRGCRDGAFPCSLHPRFGSSGAHGFDAGERFNQDAVPGCRFGLQFAHRALERPLDTEADNYHKGQHQQRNPCERPADHEEDGDEHDGEEQIGDRHDCAGREKFAYRIEFTDLISQNADRCRPLRQFYRQHVLKDVRRQNNVEFLAGHIDDPAADHAQHKIKNDGDAHPDGEGDQRWDRAVWNDTVIDVHDEKRAG